MNYNWLRNLSYWLFHYSSNKNEIDELKNIDILYDSIFQYDEIDYKKLLPTEYLELIKNIIFPKYYKADRLSFKNQSYFKYLGLIIFWASFAAIITIGLGVSFYREYLLPFFILELLFISFIGLTFGLSKQIKMHSNWIENRFLAESLRIQIFTLLFSTKEEISDHLRNLTFKDIWTFELLEEFKIRLASMKEITSVDLKTLKTFVINKWLNGQKLYHNDKYEKYKKKDSLIYKWIKYTFTLAIIISLIHIITWGIEKNLFVENVLIFVTIAMPAIGSTLAAIRSHRDYKSISFNSQIISKKIEFYERKLLVIKDHKELILVIDSIEKLFYEELERWYVLISSKELELAL